MLGRLRPPCSLCASFLPICRTITSREKSRVITSPSLVARLEQCRSLAPRPLSLQQYLDTAQDRPALYSLVREQLPLRLAGVIKKLPTYLPEAVQQQRVAQFVQDYFEMSFKEVESFPLQQEAGLEKRWLEVLTRIGIRLTGTTQMLSEAILASGVLQDPDLYAQLQQDLPEIFRQNISIDVLVGVYKPRWTKHFSLPTCIDPRNDLLGDVESAYDDARYLCEQHYISCPELEFEVNKANTVFPSIPTYNYLILFEIFKNALRATVEHHGEGSSLPPVKLVLREEAGRLEVMVVDRGGGMAKALEATCKSFFNSSAVLQEMSLYQGAHSSPLAGHGFGLGMASVYCSYWGGGLEVASKEGGTVVTMDWCTDPTLARETFF